MNKEQIIDIIKNMNEKELLSFWDFIAGGIEDPSFLTKTIVNKLEEKAKTWLEPKIEEISEHIKSLELEDFEDEYLDWIVEVFRDKGHSMISIEQKCNIQWELNDLREKDPCTIIKEDINKDLHDLVLELQPITLRMTDTQIVAVNTAISSLWDVIRASKHYSIAQIFSAMLNVLECDIRNRDGKNSNGSAIEEL